ncbi:MAG: YfhO family protein [Pirellulales bacterium]
MVCFAPFTGLLNPNGRVVEGLDYALFYLPIQEFSREEMLAGRFPLWLPYVGCGTPLHASQQASACYPGLTPLVLAFGANLGIRVSVFLHLAICFLGQYGLARHLAISRPAASLSAGVVTWSSFLVDHLAAGHITHVFGYAWIPWFFWLLLRLTRRPTLPACLGLALVVTCFHFGSHPQLVYYTLAAGTCWVAGSLVLGAASAHRGRFLAWLAAAALTTLLLAAVQWLPAVELARDGAASSDRGSAGYAGQYSMDGSDLVRLVAPNFKGSQVAGSVRFEPNGYDHERGGYVGLLTLGLALYGLSRGTAARWQWGAAWGILVATAIALGQHTPLFEPLGAIFPGLFWFRCQGRVFALVSVFAALLAGRGLDALVKGDRRGNGDSMILLAALLCVGAGIWLGAIWDWASRVDWQHYISYARAHLRGEWLAFGLIAFGSIVAAAFARRSGRDWPLAAYAAVIVVVLADLGQSTVPRFRLVPPRDERVALGPLADEPAARFAQAPSYPELGRISLQYSRAVPLAISARRTAVNTQDGGILPAALDRLYTAIEHDPPVVLRLSGCDYVWVARNKPWKELDGSLPRLRFIREPAARLCDVPIGELGEGELRILREALARTVELMEDNPHGLSIEVEAPSAGTLVVADTYYPGWTCTVDGHETPITSAHGVFRAVNLERGRHHVVFAYAPRSFRIGALASPLGLAVVAAAGWWGFRCRPRRVGLDWGQAGSAAIDPASAIDSPAGK